MSPRSRHPRLIILAGALVASLAGCGGDGGEAPSVALPVVTAATAIGASATDLGYAVTVSRMRLAIRDVELTIAGETHEAARAAPGLVLPHPGHQAGGEVTGELPGDFILDWDGREHELGMATLLAGDYQGANFAFRAASAADGLPVGDPLLGHTFHLIGEASRDGTTWPFDAALDIEAGTSLVGAVFDLDVTEASTATLHLEFVADDPFEPGTAFDGLDFATLPTGEDGTILIRPGDTAHNLLRRTIQVHDHYAIAP